jgi:hypothetical protein
VIWKKGFIEELKGRQRKITWAPPIDWDKRIEYLVIKIIGANQIFSVNRG